MLNSDGPKSLKEEFTGYHRGLLAARTFVGGEELLEPTVKAGLLARIAALLERVIAAEAHPDSLPGGDIVRLADEVLDVFRESEKILGLKPNTLPS